MALFIVLICTTLSGLHLVDSQVVSGLDTAPTVSGGVATFPSSQTMKVKDFDSKKRITLTMTLVDIGNPVHHPSNPDHYAAYYISSDGLMSCVEDCTPTSDCIARCIKRTDEGIRYYTNDIMIEIPRVPGTYDPASVIEAIPEAAFETSRRKRRRRRSTTNLTTNTIRVIYVVDREFMQTFLGITNNNAVEAKKEAELFIMIQSCETALHFASITRHNQAMTIDGQSGSLRFTTYLGHVDFPDVTPDGTNFEIPSWVLNNRDGNSLISTRHEIYSTERFIVQTGVTVDFAEYVDALHVIPHDFDLAIALTGFDITTQKMGKKGLDTEVYYLKAKNEMAKASVYSRSACRLLPKGDFSVAVIEAYTRGLSGFISQIISVMLGVDYTLTTTCGAATAVGSPYSYLSDATSTEFSTFSSCHANQISTFIAGIPLSELYPRCMLINGFTQAHFLAAFCSNRTYLSLDAQCTTLRSQSSTVCPTPDHPHLENGYVENDECLNRDNYVIVKCSINDTCTDVYDGIKRVLTGTRCLNVDGTEGNSICYEGQCVDADVLCG